MDPKSPATDLTGTLQQDEWLRRLARALAKDPLVADDLAQDAWLAALRAGRTAVADRPWLMGVLHHSTRSFFRRERRVTGDRRETASQGAAPSTESVACELELRRRLAEALLSTPEPYRTAVHLRFLRGKSLRQVAQLSGVATSTAADRVKRGLALVRQRLLKDSDGSTEGWMPALLLSAAAPSGKLKLAGLAAALALAAAGAGAFTTGEVPSAQTPALSTKKADLTAQHQGADQGALDHPLDPASEASAAPLAAPGGGRSALAAAPREGPSTAAAAALDPAAEADDEAAELLPAFIRVTCLRPTGGPSPGSWRLRAWPSGSFVGVPAGGRAGQQDRTGTLDAKGVVELTFPRDESMQYGLAITSPEGGQLGWRWSVEDLAKPLDLGQVAFKTTAPLAGVLRIEDDIPVPKGRLWTVQATWRSRAGDARSGGQETAFVDPETMAFAFANLPLGAVELCATEHRTVPGERIARNTAFGQTPRVDVDIIVAQPNTAEIVARRYGESLRAIKLIWQPYWRLTRERPDQDLVRLVHGDGTAFPVSPLGESSDWMEFHDLPDGSYTVHCDDPRFREVRHGGVEPGAALTFKIAGSSGLRPVVKDATGNLLSSYSLSAYRLETPQQSRSRVQLMDPSDPSRAQTVKGLVAGSYRVFVEAGGETVTTDVRDLLPSEIRQIEVTLVSRPAVSGVVLDGEGKPWRGLSVRLVRPAEVRDAPSSRVLGSNASTSAPERARWQVAQAATTAKGTFELVPPDDGPFLIIAGTAKESIVETKAFRTPSGGVTQVHRLLLPRGGFVEGTVPFPAGLSPEGWSVSVEPGPTEMYGRQARLTAAGTFRLGPLPPGPAELFLVEPGKRNITQLFCSKRFQPLPVGVATVIDGETVDVTAEFPGPAPALFSASVHFTARPKGHFRIALLRDPTDGQRSPAETHPESALKGDIVCARPGRYQAFVIGHGWAWIAPQSLDLKPGPSAPHPFQVELIAASVRIQGAGNAQAVDGVAVRDESGALLLTIVSNEGEQPFSLRLGPGRYRFEELRNRSGPRASALVDWPLPTGQDVIELK